MRCNFEKLLFLREDAFAAYFNGKVAAKLGRGSIFWPARLEVGEASVVADVCGELHEHLNGIRSKRTAPDLDFLLEKTYFDFEESLIDAAVQILQSPGSASAAVMSPPLVLDDFDREKLLRHIARGEQVAAEAMLKRVPYLLSSEISPIDLSRRPRVGTAQQSMFNGRVASKLGRSGNFGDSELRSAESDQIKAIRRRYYETEAYIRASAEALCSQLRETCLEEAVAVLQAGGSGVVPTAAVVAGGALALRKLSLFNSSTGGSAMSLGSSAMSLGSKEGRSSLSGASSAKERVARNELQLGEFLHHVARGERNAAEEMVRENRELLIQAGEFTDPSGRRFHCTAYQYAYWSKYTHMRRMLESYMDEGAKVFLHACIFDSRTGLARNLSYSQDGVEVQSANFDLAPLIDALRVYVDSHVDSQRGPGAPDKASKAWLRVGRLQLHLPVCAAKAYCNPRRSFDPTPSFDESDGEESELFYQNLFSGSQQFWFSREGRYRLGIDYSLTRGSGASVNMRWRFSPEHCESARLDLEALIALDRKGTEELEVSKRFLEARAPAAVRGILLR